VRSQNLNAFITK